MGLYRIFFVAMLVCFGSSVAQAASKKSGKIKFKHLTHDFGNVLRGAELSYKFEFTNAGDKSFAIRGVHASCGCTVAEFDSKRSYKPKETGTVEILLDTTNFRGKLSKTVTVMTDTTLLSTRNLTVRAVVAEEIFAEPPLLAFGDVLTGSGASKVFLVKTDKNSGIKVSDVEYDKKNMTVSMTPETDSSWKVSVKLLPGISHGFLRDTIYIKNSSSSLKKLPVLIRANIIGNFVFTPNYIEFGAVGEKELSIRSIKIKEVSSYQVVGTRSELNVNGSEVGSPAEYLKVDTSGEVGKVSLALANKEGKSGSVHGKVYFETNDPLQKEFAVDFYAFFR